MKNGSEKSISRLPIQWVLENAEAAREATKPTPHTKLKHALRSRTRVFKAINRDTVNRLLGCTPDELMNYLEDRFVGGMTWENYGLKGWHIDHIRPCSSFDLTKEDQQRECFHFTNLQPLWAKDNLRKSGSYDGSGSIDTMAKVSSVRIKAFHVGEGAILHFLKIEKFLKRDPKSFFPFPIQYGQ
jgi:hypothetical protein